MDRPSDKTYERLDIRSLNWVKLSFKTARFVLLDSQLQLKEALQQE